MAEPRRDGPTVIARHGLTDDVPAGYFERWSESAAERIRAQVPALRVKLEQQLGADAYALETDDLPAPSVRGFNGWELRPLSGCNEHLDAPRPDCRYCEAW